MYTQMLRKCSNITKHRDVRMKKNGTHNDNNVVGGMEIKRFHLNSAYTRIDHCLIVVVNSHPILSVHFVLNVSCFV